MWSPDPGRIITPLHVIACAMAQKKMCPTYGCGAPRCLLLWGVRCTLGSVASISSLGSSSEFIVVLVVEFVPIDHPPSPSHYHLPPCIPPLELTAEPSRPALYRSGRAGRRKLNPMCSADVLSVRSGGGGGKRCASPYPTCVPLPETWNRLDRHRLARVGHGDSPIPRGAAVAR